MFMSHTTEEYILIAAVPLNQNLNPDLPDSKTHVFFIPNRSDTH